MDEHTGQGAGLCPSARRVAREYRDADSSDTIAVFGAPMSPELIENSDISAAEICSDLPAGVAAALARALAQKPTERFVLATAFVRALQQASPVVPDEAERNEPQPAPSPILPNGGGKKNKLLCFQCQLLDDVEVNYENLAGEGKSSKARELVP